MELIFVFEIALIKKAHEYMRVDWIQLPDENWADFTEEGLLPFEEDREKECVYLIWSTLCDRMLYVGSGDVSRLFDHLNREDDSVYQFMQEHPQERLKFTFAYVKEGGINITEDEARGIEAFLSYVYCPCLVKRVPGNDVIKVNYPNNGIRKPNEATAGNMYERGIRAALDKEMMKGLSS